MKGRPKPHRMRLLVLMAFFSLQAHAEETPTEPATNPESTEQNQVLEQVQEELTNLMSTAHGAGKASARPWPLTAQC